MNKIPVLKKQIDVDDYILKSKPFIYRKNNCKDNNKYTFENIIYSIGDSNVRVYVSKDGVFAGGMGPYNNSRELIVNMSISELLQRINKKSKGYYLCDNEKYYAYQVPEEKISVFFENHTVPKLLDSSAINKKIKRALWIGESDNITPPHSDGWVGIIKEQLIGKKIITLWSPSNIENLYLKKFGEVHSRQSPVDISNPDFTQYPKFKDAVSYKGLLNEGDILFIPECWIHEVQSVGLTVSISYFINESEKIKKNIFSLLNIIRDLPEELQIHYTYLLNFKEGILNMVDPADWKSGNK